METMRRRLMFTASAAALLFALTDQPVSAQGEAALTGTVSSEAEGNMEGVVVTAAQPGSIVRVSVTNGRARTLRLSAESPGPRRIQDQHPRSWL
jgi:hypothetical protein